MKNTGREYESLVETVFIQLMEQDSIKNILVEKIKYSKEKLQHMKLMFTGNL